MEARLYRLAALLAAIVSLNANIAVGASSRTANFIIEAPTPELAEKIGKAAETFRRDLAVQWLGSPLKNWDRPCPIVAQVSPKLGAGGQTSFVFDRGEVFGWDMRIQGSEQRVLDSVLPHEVTHTIFATHFRQPLPRWADEGACTTVEHVSERNKQQIMLVSFLRTNRGIAFDKMFAMKDYPSDVLPLYSQGFSLSRFLIDQGGRQKFLQFVGDGMKNENWSNTIKKHYGFANLQALQDGWIEWVKAGSPAGNIRPGEVLASNDRSSMADAEPQYRAQSDDRRSADVESLAARGKSSGENSDRGWTPVNASGSPSDRFAGAARAADGPRVAMNEAPTAGRPSVYDRRSANSVASSPAASSSTAMPPPAPVPATSSTEATGRLPELMAQRDSAADVTRSRKVLLEWTRPE